MTHSHNSGTGEHSDAVGVAEDEYHRLLSSERRRLALDILRDRSAPVHLEDLAVAVAKREEGVSPGDETDIERVIVTLHHAHLPVMSELEVIDYDPHKSRVLSCPSSSALPF